MSKHSAVIAAFGHDFAAERLLDPDYHLYLREAFAQRNSADYDPDASFRLSDAAELVERAEEFLTAVEGYLEQHPERCPSAEYYVYQKGKYLYLTQNFEASGAGADADHGSEYLCEDGMYSSWVAPHAPGIGDVVTLHPVKPVHFDEIGIVPVCAERKENPLAKARIKSVEVTVNGKSSRTAMLADGDAPINSGWDASHHWVRLPKYAGGARDIQVKILSIYPGSASQSTCMSDLMLRQWLPSRPNIKSGVDGHKLP